MRLSELQNKNIINVSNGKNIGNIIDIDFNSNDGKINYLIVDPLKTGFRVFSKEEEKRILWIDIHKIGEDVILVKAKYD